MIKKLCANAFFIFLWSSLTQTSFGMSPSCLIGTYAFCIGSCLAYTDYTIEKTALKNDQIFKEIDTDIETLRNNFQQLIDVLAPHLRQMKEQHNHLAQAVQNILAFYALKRGNPKPLHIAIPIYQPTTQPSSLTPPPPPGAPGREFFTPPPLLCMSQLPTDAPTYCSFTHQKKTQSADSFSSSSPYEECQ